MAEETPSKKQKPSLIFTRSITEHRQLVALAKPLAAAAEDVFVEDVLIPVRDNCRLPVKRYLPKEEDEVQVDSTAGYPTLFYIPGTAFIAIETKFTNVICSHICSKTKCQIIVINHQLAPEAQFPAGYQDVYDTFKYFINKPRPHCIDINRIAVAGYSSGGNFAALLALQAKQEDLPLAYQILISPIVDLSRSLTKYKEFENKDTVISEEFVSWFIDLYVPQKEKSNLRAPQLSPFWSDPTRFKKLPKTDVIVAEYDRFRSDAEYYYMQLKTCGVDATRFEEKGENHSYLWYKLEVVEKISSLLRANFNAVSLTVPISDTFSISRLEPSIQSIQTSENELGENVKIK